MILAQLACRYTDTTAWVCTSPTTSAPPSPVFRVVGDHTLTTSQTVSFTLLLDAVVLLAVMLGATLRKDRASPTVQPFAGDGAPDSR